MLMLEFLSCWLWLSSDRGGVTPPRTAEKRKENSFLAQLVGIFLKKLTEDFNVDITPQISRRDSSSEGADGQGQTNTGGHRVGRVYGHESFESAN